MERARGAMNRVRAAGLCFMLALAALATLPTPASASPRSEVRQSFSRLLAQTGQLPDRYADARRVLTRTASEARKASRSSPCAALRLMRRYDSQLGQLKPGTRSQRSSAKPARPRSTRGMLETAAVAVDAALLSHPRAGRCGGADRSPASHITTKILKSGVNGLTLRVTLPQAHFAFRRLGGRDWSQLLMDDFATGGKIGQPGVPTLTEQFGIPSGANVTVRLSNVSSYVLNGVNLLPHQNEAVDARVPGQPPRETFFDQPFVIDSKAYRSDRAFPSQPGGKGPRGVMRDLQVGGAQLSGGQYRPRSDRLRVITGMDLRIIFGGQNAGTFGDARLLDPFNATFNRIYRTSLLNYSVIADHPGLGTFPFCGEEVLIVTSATLRPAANTLRTQKQAEGFVTSVVEVGAGPGQIGTTNTAIQTFIRSHLNEGCWIRPAYVILVGNTAEVPTFIVPCDPGPGAPPLFGEGSCNIASDLPYTLKDDADYLADAALGRIPAPDLATANTVVGKILNYETALPAPLADDFYRHMTVTSYFEPTYRCDLNPGATGPANCDAESPGFNATWVFHPEVTQDARGFTKTSERVRSAMTGSSYTADRLYVARPENDPQTYEDGTPMPAAIRKPGFAWDSDTADFVSAFNAGRNIVFHRDHGWNDGWADPYLSSVDVPSLTNGTQLPVTFGIDCASAMYDIPANPSFTEELLQKVGGGSVGGFGDSRNSNSARNNIMSFGFFDALFPNVLPDYGADTPLRRMGDVLLAGKQYFAGVDPVGNYSHGHLYGYFGDPTMQLWIDDPVDFDPGRIDAFVRHDLFPGPLPPGPEPGPPPFWVRVTIDQPGVEGTLVTLVEKGDVPVGRGFVRNGEAIIRPLRKPQSTAGLEIRLQSEGFFAEQAPVRGQ